MTKTLSKYILTGTSDEWEEPIPHVYRNKEYQPVLKKFVDNRTISISKSAFSKTAGVLDAPKEHLAPGVWNKNKKVHQKIKKQILTNLYKFVPRTNIKQVVKLKYMTSLLCLKNNEKLFALSLKTIEDIIKNEKVRIKACIIVS